MLESRIREFQEALVERAQQFLPDEALDESSIAAFIETPRHWFAPRFPNGEPGLWREASDTLLEANLETLYADQPYCIYHDESGRALSTISQPSLVLFMLHLLELKPGQRVFELGGGSGWNAAMMGRIVGPTGKVVSVETIDTLASNARQAIANCDLGNVSWISGDANQAIEDCASFDRGVFTASAWTLPSLFFDRIREGGILLFVFDLDESRDLLATLRKRDGRFISELHFPCRFVPAIGTCEAPEQDDSRESEHRFESWLSRIPVDIEALDLQIVPASQASTSNQESYCFIRGDSAFIWSIPTEPQA